MFAEQDARTLPGPSDPPGTVGKRATVGDQAPTQQVLNQTQEVQLCICISLVFSARWGAPSRLALNPVGLNLRAEPLPPHQHIYAWAGFASTRSQGHTHSRTFQSHVGSPPRRAQIQSLFVLS